MKVTSEKQKLLIEYLVSSPDTFALCKGIVRAEYFDPALRKTVDFLHSYYDKYNSVPTLDQIAAETSAKFKMQTVTRDQVRYCSDEVATFCKQEAFRKAVFAAPGLIDKGEFGEAMEAFKGAITISLNKDLGVNYFDDPLARLAEASQKPLRTSTGWFKIDHLLGGGMARKEIVLFSANSGGGKSITLANLAVNFLVQKLNVLYITLELSEEMVAQRFDTMFTGVPSVQWQEKYKEVGETLTLLAPHMGRLDIKHMPSGTNGNAIRGFLKELELKTGTVPDMLIVDYLDIMGANEHVSADNVWEKDKRATEQYRDILFDYNMFGATASQQNRAAITADELHQGHIAGGISKVNTVDVYISILLNESMKASGEIGFQFLKTRSSDGVGKTAYLGWDNTKLRIMNPIKDTVVDEDGVILDKIAVSKGKILKKRSLEDLMDI